MLKISSKIVAFFVKKLWSFRSAVFFIT